MLAWSELYRAISDYIVNGIAFSVYNGNMTQATDFDELTKVLETLVRKVMREELANFARENGLFYLSLRFPESDFRAIGERTLFVPKHAQSVEKVSAH